MESGQGSLDALRAVLGRVDEHVFVRAVVETGRRAVWHVDAIVAPPAVPAGWQPLVWEYEPVTFIAWQVSSGALAAALDPDDAQVLPLGPYALTLPSLSAQLNWRHQPSCARYDSILLPWPTSIFELQQPGRPERQTPRGYLIGDDCPSFPSYERAFRAFFYGEFSGPAGPQVPSSFATVRVVDATAWLKRVLIKPTYLEVSVGGSDITGTRVELNGATYQAAERVAETEQVRLPLPDGFPANAWLYLSRDKRWLDYRAIGEYPQADLARVGVEVEFPKDPDAEIQTLVSHGEGQQVEFKRQLPEDSVDSKRTVLKTVAAFANGDGGKVVFGVEKDEATICGLEGIDLVKERDRLAQLVRSIVTPAPHFEVRQYDVYGNTVLVLFVERGTDPPYGITLPGRKDKPVEFYVRRDATTFPARSDEIRNAVLATAPLSAPGLPWLSTG